MPVPGLEIAEDIVRRVGAAGADEAQVEHVVTERFELDADTGGVNLVRTASGVDTAVTAIKDGRKGAATLSGRDESDIESAIEAALDGAAAGVADPANAVADAPSRPPSRHGPEAPDREAMFDAVTEHLALVAERYPQILTRHCLYVFGRRTRSFANSNGVRQEETRGAYHLTTMFGAKEGGRSTSFNYTGVTSYERFERLMDVGTVARLMGETVASFEPRPVPEKFVGDVIITPDCLSSFIHTLTGALGGYALMAETTPYRGREGEAIASPGFSLANRPRSEAFPEGADFDECGVPTRDLAVIEAGVLNAFLVDFFVSRKLGIEQTAGHGSYVVAGGEKPIDQLIAETERGIVLSRFSGGQPNNELDFSGVAKNSFYVEEGRIRQPLIETMVSGNLQRLLHAIRGASLEVVNFGSGAYPYLVAGGVTISGSE